MRRRLDAELVRRGLARSREHAAELVAAGRVSVGGRPAVKAATQVDAAAAVLVSDPGPADSWVGRGAGKLDGALDALAARGLAPEVRGRTCLDAGASTGGFTQVLLARGAALVHAVDVGYGQLAWSLRTDDRVRVHERTNVRDLAAGSLEPVPDLVVADLSFISLRLVLPALVEATAPGAEHLLMVKPQFEAGRDRVGAGGVVRDPAVREDTVVEVCAAAGALGLRTVAVTASPLPGPAGNVEYFVLLRGDTGHADDPTDVRGLVHEAVLAGPAGASEGAAR
ncbi:TlyA family rRNA (cytidine-2'-O)-methyltransferase [Aquipuribacter nitratireducens]|uniref:TlyA family RNA methyltransferase n=1 Tax=Aquipuribacter nitratireducens TaxID=650104 RepID=A0ABW0GQ61_9MICO